MDRVIVEGLVSMTETDTPPLLQELKQLEGSAVFGSARKYRLHMVNELVVRGDRIEIVGNVAKCYEGERHVADVNVLHLVAITYYS